MPRISIISLAAAVMAATTAHASSGFGASGWSAGASAPAARESNPSVFISFLNFFNAQISAMTPAPAPTPVAEKARHPNTSHYECQTTKKEEEEKLAEARRLKNVGPEPVYLAF